MPRPLPDYVRSPAREKIKEKFPERGMKELAETIGTSYGAVVNNLKRNKGDSLRAFLEMADRRGLDPDKLAEILDLKPEDRKNALGRQLGKEHAETVKEMADDEIDAYLYSMLAGKSGNPVNKIYLPMAKALDLTLPEIWVSING